jgi:hypothetical protein
MRGLLLLALAQVASGCAEDRPTRPEPPPSAPAEVTVSVAKADPLPTRSPEQRTEASSGCVAADAGAGSLECPTYERYVNSRFAFSVDVPTLFAKKGADADGRGQPFEYGSKARIRAWAMYDSPATPESPPMTAEELYRDWTRRDHVTFKMRAMNTWVVRGAERGRLHPNDAPVQLAYYSRSILADGIITTVEVWYDPSLADAFEPIVARVGASLMTIPGEGVRARVPRR